MIIVDTSILSSLAKIKYLHLIKEIFCKEQIVICSAVKNELLVSKEKGYEFVDRILKHTALKVDELDNTRWLLIRYPDEQVSVEIKDIYDKYPHIHFGEIESIAFAKIHDTALLIDDRRALNVAKKENIQSFTLPAIIHYAKDIEILTVEEISNIIHFLEIKDHYLFKYDVKRTLLE